jgi:hypothetical protein
MHCNAPFSVPESTIVVGWDQWKDEAQRGSNGKTPMTLPTRALAFTGFMALGALVAVGYALHTVQPLHDYRFGVVLILAVATARLKVTLPGLTGNMAVNLPYVLIAAAQLSMLEALLVALPSCALQCIPNGGGKPNPVQMIFNLSTMGVAVASASLIGAHFVLLGAACFFLAQTVPVASIIHFTEGGAIRQIWCSMAHYSFPFYVLSTGISSIATSSTTQFGWQALLLGLPVLYAIYRSYQSYFRVPSLALRSSVEAQ